MRLVVLLLAAILLTLPHDSVAQTAGAKPRIEWEVKNRFRLFRSESDFQRHVAAWRVVDEVRGRDILIAGMGDPVPAGEGNPDRPVRLSNEGFCFQRFLSGEGSQYYRPSRAGYAGNRSCVTDSDPNADAWARQS